ncbi:hypothetical protein FRC09_013959 [Ceratobasidium sp. 395]|nr:hypothetical protein FRC09_013959 [Ceratobasidium sp. 395]
MSPQHIFFLGATGYVGGSLLVKLLTEYPSATFTALVRQPEAAQIVKALAPSRITIALGSHSDLALIEQESTKADLVVNAASCDDVALTKSVINGLGKREKKGLLLHTSGIAIIFDGDMTGTITAQGQKIWDDTNAEDMRVIPPAAPHRPVDLEVLTAHNAGVIDGVIVCPGLIYGVGTGPINRKSLQIPKVVQTALRRRAVVHVGEGSNIWSNIHINDLVQLYLTVLKHSLPQHEQGVKTDANDNYYFATSGEKSIHGIAELVAPLLHKKDLIDTPQVQTVNLEEEQELGMYLAHTARAAAKRARNLGWSAKENLDEVIEKDLEVILQSLLK